MNRIHPVIGALFMEIEYFTFSSKVTFRIHPYLGAMNVINCSSPSATILQRYY
jgi:hypothetical protein